MTEVPSAGWREVYQWCHVDVGDDLPEHIEAGVDRPENFDCECGVCGAVQW